MKLGIDGSYLERKRTGVGRCLESYFPTWVKQKNLTLFVYFEDRVPNDEFLKSSNVKCKIVKPSPFLPGSLASFVRINFLVPFHVWKDKVDSFFAPNYYLPICIPRGVKTGVLIHDISYEVFPEWYDKKYKIIRWLTKRSVKKADIIFAVSEFSKSEVVKHYSIDPKRVVVAYNAAEYLVRDVETSLTRDLKEKKIFITIGSIVTRRWHKEMIEAFGRLGKDRKDVVLLIIGANFSHPHIDVEKYCVDANAVAGYEVVRYLGFYPEEDMRSLYFAALGVVYLSDYEGFGLPVLEGMVAQKAVVTNDSTSIPEVGGDVVWYVKDRSVGAVYEILREMIENDVKRESMIKSAKERSKMFSWEDSALKIIKNLQK